MIEHEPITNFAHPFWQGLRETALLKGLTVSAVGHAVLVSVVVFTASTATRSELTTRDVPLSVAQVDVSSMFIKVAPERAENKVKVAETPRVQTEATAPAVTEREQDNTERPVAKKMAKKSNKRRRARRAPSKPKVEVANSEVSPQAPATVAPPSSDGAGPVVLAQNEKGARGGSRTSEDAVTTAPDGDENGTGEYLVEVSGVSDAGLMAAYRMRVSRVVGKRYRYPTRARRAGLEGRVVVGINVDARGAIKWVKVVVSSGSSILDRNALETARSIATLPAPPTELHWKDRTIRVPIVYSMRHAG